MNSLLSVQLPWLVALPTALTPLLPYLPFIVLGLILVLGGLVMVAEDRFNGFVRQTVAAVYRVAIRAAGELEDEGLAWLRSEDGISFRRGLVERAYDYIPTTIGPVPVGFLKVLVTREKFCEMVEAAFQEMVELAEKLELPEDIDPVLAKLLGEAPKE